MKFILIILITLFHTFFLLAEEPSFKFSFGSNLGNIPLEINKVSKNIKSLAGININSWILSPNFSSFTGDKKLTNFSENKNSKDSIYIKFNFKF